MALKVAAGHYHLFHRVAPTIAKAKGYFARDNLEVTISATGTDVKSLQALTRGDLDLIIDLKSPVALQGKDRGDDVYFIGGFLNTYPGTLVGAKGIRSTADLKGKKIGLREPNGVQLTLSSMVLQRAGIDPRKDVIFVPHTGSSSFKSIAPKLDQGIIQARIAHSAYAEDFRDAGYAILADLKDYLPDGYQLRGIAATGLFLRQQSRAVIGFLKGIIRAYRFMKNTANHPEMMEIIRNSDLEFEADMDQGMWEEEYPLIPGIPADGSINTKGLEVILNEEKSLGRVSQSMTVDQILRLEFVQQALKELERNSHG
jgi:ABC-type nitrate/sulfonate/bicarbonate transport system substrate-binding protein